MNLSLLHLLLLIPVLVLDSSRTPSIIIPIHNGQRWVDSCFGAIFQQTAIGQLNFEICICNDASTDKTIELLSNWNNRFNENGISFKIFNNTTGNPKGVGYAKNRAVQISSGSYLCFQDVDDIMLPNRLISQFEKAVNLPNTTLIGSQFIRTPENSTIRYTKWANHLTQNQLDVQVYTSHGPTIIMPTWFCHRNVFDRIGGFSEQGKGTPEDLIFFYKHLDLGGKISRVDECLQSYTYHQHSATFSIDEETIWLLRLERLQKSVLTNWKQFTIWNAGKQGRKLYNALSVENRHKVVALCDVDGKKIGRSYTPYDTVGRTVGKSVDIVHFTEAQSPFVICVKLDMSNGEFEKRLDSLNLKEGIDYIHFN